MYVFATRLNAMVLEIVSQRQLTLVANICWSFVKRSLHSLAKWVRIPVARQPHPSKKFPQRAVDLEHLLCMPGHNSWQLARAHSPCTHQELYVHDAPLVCVPLCHRRTDRRLELGLDLSCGSHQRPRRLHSRLRARAQLPIASDKPVKGPFPRMAILNLGSPHSLRKRVHLQRGSQDGTRTPLRL